MLEIGTPGLTRRGLETGPWRTYTGTELETADTAKGSLVQPATAVLQPVKVRSRRPPRVPCSDTRLTGRVTFPRESSGRKSSAAGDVSPGRIGPGGRATARAVASRTPMVSVETLARLKPMSGLLEEPTHLGNEEGDRSRDASGIGTCFSSRRRGDGTRGRSADPTWGRSRRQPRPGRRARPPV